MIPVSQFRKIFSKCICLMCESACVFVCVNPFFKTSPVCWMHSRDLSCSHSMLCLCEIKPLSGVLPAAVPSFFFGHLPHGGSKKFLNSLKDMQEWMSALCHPHTVLHENKPLALLYLNSQRHCIFIYLHVCVYDQTCVWRAGVHHAHAPQRWLDLFTEVLFQKQKSHLIFNCLMDSSLTPFSFLFTLLYEFWCIFCPHNKYSR